MNGDKIKIVIGYVIVYAVKGEEGSGSQVWERGATDNGKAAMKKVMGRWGDATKWQVDDEPTGRRGQCAGKSATLPWRGSGGLERATRVKWRS